jgi:transcriptional regulator with PAS, ATPase and Fis domain
MISVYSNKLKKTVAYPSNDIIDFLKDYNWPGNFEEFQQLVNDFIISGDEKKLLDYAMKRLIVTPNNVEKDFPRLPDTTKKLVSKIEKDLIIRALEVSSKNKKKASKLLGISYKTLVQKMKKYGIK